MGLMAYIVVAINWHKFNPNKAWFFFQTPFLTAVNLNRSISHLLWTESTSEKKIFSHINYLWLCYHMQTSLNKKKLSATSIGYKLVTHKWRPSLVIEDAHWSSMCSSQELLKQTQTKELSLSRKNVHQHALGLDIAEYLSVHHHLPQIY